MAVESTPAVPAVAITKLVNPEIKVATPDIILIDQEALPIEIMTDLVFEDIGSQEVINIARNDTVNGQNIVYQPIKNLSSLAIQYNPKNILSLQDSSESYFQSFSISLDTHTPNIGTGPNGEIIYIDQTTGDLVVNVINTISDEQVEIQVFNSGSLLDDTIY